MASESRLGAALTRRLPALLSGLMISVGSALLLLNRVIVNDPGPSSGELRDYLAVWPAGMVLLGVGSAGLLVVALIGGLSETWGGSRS